MIALAVRAYYWRPPLIVRVAAAVLMAFIVVCLMFSTVASAATTAQVSTEVEPFVDVKTWLLLLGVVTPFVTAAVTRAGASDAVKAAVSAVTIGLVAVVVTGLESGGLTFEKWLNGSLQVLAAHLATWLMAGKAVDKVNAAVPGVIGGS